jgi:hydrogenase nickel incorporation protein HypA/HybF
MHEYSLAQSLLIESDRVRREHGGGRLTALHVEVGELAGVEPELLVSAVEMLLAGGPDEGVTLELERVAVQARCQDCGGEFRVQDLCFHCPDCGGGGVKVIRGDSLLLRDVTFEKAEVQCD